MMLSSFVEYKIQNGRFISLMMDNDKNYYCLYGKVILDPINVVIDSHCCVSKHEATSTINFVEGQNNTLFHVVKLHNKDEYKTVTDVIESLL